MGLTAGGEFLRGEFVGPPTPSWTYSDVDSAPYHAGRYRPVEPNWSTSTTRASPTWDLMHPAPSFYPAPSTYTPPYVVPMLDNLPAAPGRRSVGSVADPRYEVDHLHMEARGLMTEMAPLSPAWEASLREARPRVDLVPPTLSGTTLRGRSTRSLYGSSQTRRPRSTPRRRTRRRG